MAGPLFLVVPAHLRSAWRRSRASRGQIVILFALSLPVVLGGLGLSVDIGMALLTRTSAQKTADAAAIAGADYQLTSISTGSSSTAAQEATLYAEKNGYTSSEIVVRVGTSNFQVACTHCTTDDANDYIEATVTH